jgi:broad-specificity NMP kinase
MYFKIKRELLQMAMRDLELSTQETVIIVALQANVTMDYVDVDSQDLTVALLSYFLKNSPHLPNKTKSLLSKELFGEDSVVSENSATAWETPIRKLADIVECFTRIGIKSYNTDYFFLNQWFPVIAYPCFIPGNRSMPARVNVLIKVSYLKENHDIGFTVYHEDLLGRDGKLAKITLKDLFKRYGCKPLETNLDENRQFLSRAKEIENQNVQMFCKGYGITLIPQHYSNHTKQVLIKMGSKDLGDRVIVENELEYEVNSQKNAESEQYLPLPIIRVFSFLHKKYCFVAVKDLTEYEYNIEAVNSLFLPDKLTSILRKVFAAPVEDLVGDILSNKHGGMIILAAGNPGVGKTSTAEVYSEMQQMSLYMLDISELGTNAVEVENSLSTVFKRVEKWNSIILFDEVDIFLAKRDNKNLDRAAIVGIFLRLMDYFKGVMFLTTNRPEVLDFAVQSRITLRIDYPDFNETTREKVWKEKLNRVSINLTDGFNEISKLNLNGREIRNTVRLAKIILPSRTNQKDLINLIVATNPKFKFEIAKTGSSSD